MLLSIFRQMIALDRHPRTFARVDRSSLALCDRIGLTYERPDLLVQRCDELPQIA